MESSALRKLFFWKNTFFAASPAAGINIICNVKIKPSRKPLSALPTLGRCDPKSSKASLLSPRAFAFPGFFPLGPQPA